MKISFSVFAGIMAIFVFAAVALALALYAFLKIQGAHECYYYCPESGNVICAFQTEEHMKNRTEGMNFSSICHRDVFNCQNPKHSYKFDTKGPCSTSIEN